MSADTTSLVTTPCSAVTSSTMSKDAGSRLRGVDHNRDHRNPAPELQQPIAVRSAVTLEVTSGRRPLLVGALAGDLAQGLQCCQQLCALVGRHPGQQAVQFLSASPADHVD